MEAFLPHQAFATPPSPVERLMFDILRASMVARQAATPTARQMTLPDTGEAVAAAESADGRVSLLLGHRPESFGGSAGTARFADCSIGRVLCTTGEVSA